MLETPASSSSLHATLDALPLAHVDGEGTIVHVNQAGRTRWGRLDGIRLPEEVLMVLQSRATGTLEPLPLPVAGLRTLCAPLPEGGWLLVGFVDTGIMEVDAPDAHERLAEAAPVTLLRLRTDGVLVYANSPLAELTGHAVAVLLGRPFWQELIHPEDRHRFTAALRQVAEQKPAFVRARLRHADGSLRRVEIRLRPSGWGGEAVAAVLDVTEQDELASALLQSEALYQTFLEQSPVGIFHLDREGTVTFENHRLRQITGEEPDEVWIGRALAEIDGVDPRLVEHVRTMLHSGHGFGAEDLRIEGSGGTEHIVTVHGSPIRHPEEGIVGGALMVFDVTSERERERELRTLLRYDAAESALRTEALSLTSEHAFLDQAARILGETARAEQVFVLLPAADAKVYEEEIRWGRHPERSLVPLRLEGLEPSLVEALLSGRYLYESAAGPGAALLQSLGAREAVTLPLTTAGAGRGLLLLTRTDAAMHWAPTERRALAQLGALVEMLCGWMRAEARYRQVVSSIEDALFAFGFTTAGRRSFSLVTRQVEGLSGITPDALLTGEIDWAEEVVHPEDRDALAEHERALREGRESRLVYRVLHADGQARWVRESASGRRDAAGRLVVSGILSDVTEQKLTEASLVEAKQDAEAANRMKSTFLATMSHELRTPLGAIKGFAELLTEEVAALDAPAPEVVEFAGVIRTNAEKVLGLVGDLLELARLQADRVTLDTAPVPLAPLVERAAESYRTRFAQAGIDFKLDLGSEPLLALADARRLEQVLGALLSNALKFTEAGRVRLTADAGGEYVALRVADTGIGISKEYVPQLFEPFTQEDHQLNRQYEGSGMGLALAHRFVVAMGGRLLAESQKGKGSTFVVELPRADA